MSSCGNFAIFIQMRMQSFVFERYDDSMKIYIFAFKKMRCRTEK